MSGVTKKIYERDIFDVNVMWNNQVKHIKNILPINYRKEDVLNAVKKYYPHEWKGVEYKKKYYDKKDCFLKRRYGKTRYNMPDVQTLFYKNSQVRNICSEKIRNKYSLEFNDAISADNEKKLRNERKPKIKRIDDKILKAKSKVQTVTPVFLDKLIGLYERKSTSQKDRIYIIRELMKYYNDEVISFFFKINDTELNRQLREIAFKHLQSFNYSPRLRSQKYMQIHTNNKKRKEYLTKIYPNETYNILSNPEELVYRIQNGKEQKLKNYDYFISHSSKDSKIVQSLIDHENSIGKNIFCDWICDSDYLKRELLCEATLNVIEKRIEESDSLIFVKSNNSLNSVWCMYELNYGHELGKTVYFITSEDIEKEKFSIKKYDVTNYLNKEYRKLEVLGI